MPVCPQLPSRLRGVMGDFEAVQSEDCLKLTVWTPAADNKKRPVVVWFHGGAWQSGGGALGWYDGSALCRLGDVVVVGVNYRLASLGWLYVPGETSNVGLLDHEAALEWVAQHIEAFGGDPDQVTAMGQSAGGFNIAAMLTRRPKFHRAILQSASLGRGFRDADTADTLSQAFLNAAAVSTLDQARALPIETLLKAQQAEPVIQALKAEGANRSLFCPVMDGVVIDNHRPDLLRTAAGQVDVLVGYTKNEMAAFPGTPVDAKSDALGDEIFGAPARRWADDARAQGKHAWVFRFDYGPNPIHGACHCIELPFMFGTLDAFSQAPFLKGMESAHGQYLAGKMQGAWIAFIRGGSPGWDEAPYIHAYQ
jgi:para-nitrobenzyl esterase